MTVEAQRDEGTAAPCHGTELEINKAWLEALRALGCNGCSLSCDRTTCRVQDFSPKSDFFEEATCPGQLRCLGQKYS